MWIGKEGEKEKRKIMGNSKRRKYRKQAREKKRDRKGERVK